MVVQFVSKFVHFVYAPTQSVCVLFGFVEVLVLHFTCAGQLKVRRDVWGSLVIQFAPPFSYIVVTISGFGSIRQ